MVAHEPPAADAPPPAPKSRSQQKREAQAIAAIGEDLERLPSKALDRIPLPEAVRTALDELRRINAHGAHKRQLGYLGRLLRGCDLAPINAALDRELDRGKAGSIAARRLEIWRDRILAEGDAAIDAFVAEQPSADRQRLRQLYRRTRKADKDTPRHARNTRELLAYLREVTRASSG